MKMNGESLDITKENIDKLKQLFPEILTDGNKIDFEKLKTVLGEEVEGEKERYSFNWYGKKNAILGAQTPSKGTLRPDEDKSKNFDTTENLYIEGDNLEVLKLLQKSYSNKVKMIYIDPPYNTGRDFIYKDNFKVGIDNYLEQTEQVDNNGNILSTNTENNGRYHSNWINMMYPRLKLSRNLLTKDGVIFISIDENEVTNLLNIMNEIFGENNRVAVFPWQARTSVQNDTDISISHEFIICYAKNRRIENRRLKEQNKNIWNSKDSFAFFPMKLDINSFSNPDNDLRGPWKKDPFDAPNIRPNLTYEITNPNTGEKFLPPKGRHWRTEEKKYNELFSQGRIIFGVNGTARPQLKVYYNEKKDFGSVETSWFEASKYDTATTGTKQLQKIFGSTGYFDTPKPTKLINKIINMTSKSNDIILDFFSGSATTAHATMQLNAEDGGNRKFIMVQLPEKLDEKSEPYKDGYRTICDIGEERIRRAGELVKQELIEKNAKAGMLADDIVDPEQLDIGFKVLKLDKSNIREWNSDFEDLEDNLFAYEDVFVESRSELDVVYEIMLKNGLELTYNVKQFEHEDKNVYDIAYGNLFICLADNIDVSVAQIIVEKRNEYGIDTSSVVFKDAGFKSDADKLNVIELLKDSGYPEENILTI